MIVKKIKVKELYGNYCIPNFDPEYNWEELKEDIKTNGVLRRILVFQIETVLNVSCIGGSKGFVTNITSGKQHPIVLNGWPDVKYYILDGNHRCQVLKELYGDDHEFEVSIDDRPHEHNYYGNYTNAMHTIKTMIESDIERVAERTDVEFNYELDRNVGIFTLNKKFIRPKI